MSENPADKFPQKEVIEFWGRPSDGTFRRVAKVQDAVIIEPVANTFEKLNEVAKVYFSQPGIVDKFPPVEGTAMAVRDVIEIDYDEAERRVAAAMAARPKPPRVRSRTFPNDSTQCGNYGMWQTKAGHRLAVYRCLKALRPIADTFDAIYVTGLSGTVPAAVVAHVLHKDLLVLRKQTDRGETLSHGCLLEGPTGGDMRYMILDDFVSGGGTLRRLLAHLPGRLAGIMLYGHPRGKNEVTAGHAKMLATYPDGEYKPCKWWYMMRRDPKSMLFDLKEVPQ